MNLPPYRLANSTTLISVRDSKDPSKRKLAIGKMGDDNHFNGYQFIGGALDQNAIDKKAILPRMFVGFHRMMARRKETHGDKDYLIRLYSMYEKMLTHNRSLGKWISDLVKPKPGEQFSLEASVKSELMEEIGLKRRHINKNIAPIYVAEWLPEGVPGDQGHPTIIYHLELDLTDKELKTIFNHSQREKQSRGVKPELSDIEFVDETSSAIENFLNNAKERNIKLRPYLIPVLQTYVQDRESNKIPNRKPRNQRNISNKLRNIAKATSERVAAITFPERNKHPSPREI